MNTNPKKTVTTTTFKPVSSSAAIFTHNCCFLFSVFTLLFLREATTVIQLQVQSQTGEVLPLEALFCTYTLKKILLNSVHVKVHVKAIYNVHKVGGNAKEVKVNDNGAASIDAGEAGCYSADS